MLKNYLKPAGLEDLCVLMDATDPGLGLVKEPQSPAELEDLSPTTLSVLMDASVAADPGMSLVEEHQPPALGMLLTTTRSHLSHLGWLVGPNLRRKTTFLKWKTT